MRFEGRRLHPGELVVCADEKPSIQARARIHPGLAPAPGHGQRIEHTYERRGALTYLGAWDIKRAECSVAPSPGAASSPSAAWSTR